MIQRKLSDILIEIAMQGLKHPSAFRSPVMHPLMWLAHVAWNRETDASDYMESEIKRPLKEFHIEERILNRDLISRNWVSILDRMRAYKRARFPDDSRIITMCGHTSYGSWRVEFRLA